MSGEIFSNRTYTSYRSHRSYQPSEPILNPDKARPRVHAVEHANLRPAILDETDSGLDSDAVRVVSEGIARLTGGNTGVLIITHHERLLEFNKPHFVHILLGGRIVETGGWELAHEVHARGYAKIREKYPDAAADEDKMTQPKNPELEAAVS